MSDSDQKNLQNRVLAGLSPADFALLKPHLEYVDLPIRKLLEGRHRRIEHVYFLESGLASVVVTGGSQYTVEAAMIGREGMTGLAVVMAVDRSPHETFIQSAGAGWRIAAPELVRLMTELPRLRLIFLRHAHTLMVQMSFTALANARYKVDERLARWLLMAQDRSDGTDIALTHEFLSVMLGVRRPGVTTALNSFERMGLIAAKRGSITVLDRGQLEDKANGSYGAPEAEFERMFSLA